MMVDSFRASLVTSMGCDPSILQSPGVTVAGHPNRAESKVTSGYVFGDHFVVTCDPAVEATLTQALVDTPATLQAWEQVATDLQGELLGRGRMSLRANHDDTTHELPDGYRYQPLDRDDADDLELIAALIAGSSEDDLDEAEIEIDDLDPHIVAVLDADGAIASYAAARPFDMAKEFGDIGILTRPDCRGIGLGAAAVQAICREMITAGLEPLYRCDQDNHASVALSESLGFTPTTILTAYRF